MPTTSAALGRRPSMTPWTWSTRPAADERSQSCSSAGAALVTKGAITDSTVADVLIDACTGSADLAVAWQIAGSCATSIGTAVPGH